eukprot:1806736-Rhodomonas_salina.1
MPFAIIPVLRTWHLVDLALICAARARCGVRHVLGSIVLHHIRYRHRPILLCDVRYRHRPICLMRYLVLREAVLPPDDTKAPEEDSQVASAGPLSPTPQDAMPGTDLVYGAFPLRPSTKCPVLANCTVLSVSTPDTRCPVLTQRVPRVSPYAPNTRTAGPVLRWRMPGPAV